MKKSIKFIYAILIIFASIFIISACLLLYLYFTSEIQNPIVKEVTNYKISCSDSVYYFGPSKLRKNYYEMYEIYVEGDAVNRGNAYGILLKDQLHFQEEVFVDKLHEYVPNESYLKFLRFILRIAMRGVTDYIPEEYCTELYAISKYCSDEFNWAGSPYERQINYHAAHDIGHAMVDYMLVGCSSFGCWNSYSNDSNLIIGRNFDFYVSDDFAKNKVVTICNPDKGYKYISISWPGMIGVLSGMNSQGLTVTINAAKGKIPIKTAMPITLLAREIVQYASNMEEAYQIALKHKTFVSESILIGSAKENKAAIIEKTTNSTQLFMSDNDFIICTNHYQSDSLKNTKVNIENIQNSDSKKRYDRLKYLIDYNKPINPLNSANILRNSLESDSSDLKLCSECAINQFISHHSVIFKPNELKVWISTAPWQLGDYICYDLSDSLDFSEEIYNADLTISADSFLNSKYYKNLLFYKKTANDISRAIWNNSNVKDNKLDSFIKSNPNHFQTYKLVGDYYESVDDLQLAKFYWNEALKRCTCKKSDRNHLINKLRQ